MQVLDKHQQRASGLGVWSLFFISGSHDPVSQGSQEVGASEGDQPIIIPHYLTPVVGLEMSHDPVTIQQMLPGFCW